VVTVTVAPEPAPSLPTVRVVAVPRAAVDPTVSPASTTTVTQGSALAWMGGGAVAAVASGVLFWRASVAAQTRDAAWTSYLGAAEVSQADGSYADYASAYRSVDQLRALSVLSAAVAATAGTIGWWQWRQLRVVPSIAAGSDGVSVGAGASF
jgi:hypothetical protein